MKDGIYLKISNKLYHVHKNAKCTKRTCSLFVRGVCRSAEWVASHPCNIAFNMIRNNGLKLTDPVNYKEVKPNAKW